MGAEEFRVTLRSRCSVAEADRRLLSLPGMERDERPNQVSACGKLIYVSVPLVAEAEVWRHELGSQTILGFAVCHPASSDSLFCELLVTASEVVDAQSISIAEDLPRGAPGDFSPEDVAGVRLALVECVARKREWWVADFGAEEAVVLPAEAIRRFILREPVAP